LYPAQGFLIPKRLQLPIGCGETRRQGRVENNRQLRPICWSTGQTLKVLARRMASAGGFAVDDVFQFVEQFLGAPDAERGNQHAALILQRLLDDCFEALTPAAAVFMEA